jgi:hypothetical protein
MCAVTLARTVLFRNIEAAVVVNRAVKIVRLKGDVAPAKEGLFDRVH